MCRWLLLREGRVTRPGLTTDAGLLAFDRKKSAHRHLSGSRSYVDWDLVVRARSESEVCYASAKARYSEQCVARLDASLTPGDWWRALKGPVFGSSSAILPLQGPGRGLVSNPVGKAEILSSWFDSKQSRVAVVLPSTCHPRPVFCKFAFRSSEVSRLLQDLDGSGSVDPSEFFALFFGRQHRC